MSMAETFKEDIGPIGDLAREVLQLKKLREAESDMAGASENVLIQRATLSNISTSVEMMRTMLRNITAVALAMLAVEGELEGLTHIQQWVEAASEKLPDDETALQMVEKIILLLDNSEVQQ